MLLIWVYEAEENDKWYHFSGRDIRSGIEVHAVHCWLRRSNVQFLQQIGIVYLWEYSQVRKLLYLVVKCSDALFLGTRRYKERRERGNCLNNWAPYKCISSSWGHVTTNWEIIRMFIMINKRHWKHRTIFIMINKGHWKHRAILLLTGKNKNEKKSRNSFQILSQLI